MLPCVYSTLQTKWGYVNANVLKLFLARFFLCFIKYLSCYVCLFFMANWIVWIPSKKKAGLTRINIWIYIEISTSIYISIDTVL